MKVWIAKHGHKHPLTPELREQFLARPEVPAIIAYPDASIRHCVSRYNKLEDILKCLAKAPQKQTTEAPSPKPSGLTTRGGRSRQAGSVWQPPVNPQEAKKATVDFDRQHREYP